MVAFPSEENFLSTNPSIVRPLRHIASRLLSLPLLYMQSSLHELPFFLSFVQPVSTQLLRQYITLSGSLPDCPPTMSLGLEHSMLVHPGSILGPGQSDSFVFRITPAQGWP